MNLLGISMLSMTGMLLATIPVTVESQTGITFWGHTAEFWLLPVVYILTAAGWIQNKLGQKQKDKQTKAEAELQKLVELGNERIKSGLALVESQKVEISELKNKVAEKEAQELETRNFHHAKGQEDQKIMFRMAQENGELKNKTNLEPVLKRLDLLTDAIFSQTEAINNMVKKDER